MNPLKESRKEKENRREGSSSHTYTSDIKCFKCLSRGHLLSQCPTSHGELTSIVAKIERVIIRVRNHLLLDTVAWFSVSDWLVEWMVDCLFVVVCGLFNWLSYYIYVFSSSSLIFFFCMWRWSYNVCVIHEYMQIFQVLSRW